MSAVKLEQQLSNNYEPGGILISFGDQNDEYSTENRAFVKLKRYGIMLPGGQYNWLRAVLVKSAWSVTGQVMCCHNETNNYHNLNVFGLRYGLLDVRDD